MAMEQSDITLAEKLRREDPEQFYTLVRMHLSFILDLHTDESDVTPEKNKLKPPRWAFVPFTKKNKYFTKGVMEGAPLTQEGICQVYQLIEFLGKEQNIVQEGIFRRSGKITRQNELKSVMNRGGPLNLEKSDFSVHDCASVLKNFLAELPEPLLTDAHFPAYYQIADLCSEVEAGRGSDKRLLRAVQLLLLLLPVENRLLLKDLLQLLHKTAAYEAYNKMSANNLATLFTPHFICPRKLTPESLHNNSQKMSGVVAFMIKQENNLFNIPVKLATDIRAYWVEHNKTKLTPQQNEDNCDGLTASTVFTFVDRERSAKAQEQVGDPTEAALAQLYAHIRALPESHHKRRLVKQFNHENGRGTPLRFMAHARSRSLGDSIKKRIFKNGAKIQKIGDSPHKENNIIHSLSQEVINETMMTPRSRKPVIVLSGSNLCNLASLSSADKPNQGRKRGTDDNQQDISKNGSVGIENSVNECQSVKNLGFVESIVSRNMKKNRCISSVSDSVENQYDDLLSMHTNDILYEESDRCSPPSTFKSYLSSRSVLTATPVDLSFMSHEGDLDSSAEEKRILQCDINDMSKSLIFCLDGGHPSSPNCKAGENFNLNENGILGIDNVHCPGGSPNSDILPEAGVHETSL